MADSDLSLTWRQAVPNAASARMGQRGYDGPPGGDPVERPNDVFEDRLARSSAGLAHRMFLVPKATRSRAGAGARARRRERRAMERAASHAVRFPATGGKTPAVQSDGDHGGGDGHGS